MSVAPRGLKMDPMLAMLAALPKMVDPLENGKGLGLSSVPTHVSTFRKFSKFCAFLLQAEPVVYDRICTAIACIHLDPW